MNTRKPYPTDLSDEQWQLIQPLLPPAKPGGRPRRVNPREIINAIFYHLRAGCVWRLLPHDLPPWGTVHYYHRKWRMEGVWQSVAERSRAYMTLCANRCEPKPAKKPHPAPPFSTRSR